MGCKNSEGFFDSKSEGNRYVFPNANEKVKNRLNAERFKSFWVDNLCLLGLKINSFVRSEN